MQASLPIDISMDPLENNGTADINNSEEQQNQSEGSESNVRPTLSQVKKSWGFRRSTIARREFLDEVGDLAHSPPPVRRCRSRRSNQTPQATSETGATQRTTPQTRSVLDDLEWSAPSSPVSEESKPTSEASTGVSLDPSLWQDFGSAFHTAFSLLGGNEGLSMDMSDAPAAPDILKATDAIEAPPTQVVDEPEVPDTMDTADDTEMSQPVAPDNVAGGESDDVVLISSQEEDSDEMTLIQIKEKLASKSRQGDTRARGGKGGRGKARGRGRGKGKGKGKGRGRGRGRAVEPHSSFADSEDKSEEVIMVKPAEQQLQEEAKVDDPHGPAEIEISSSPSHSDICLSPSQRSSSDCIYIESDLDQIADAAPGQYDDAPEEQVEEEKKDDMNAGVYSVKSNSKSYDSNALYCICQQKHNERFMICCDSCQDWFHGSCVGIRETQGRKMERTGQEFICPRCTTKKQSHLQPEPQPQPKPVLSLLECSVLSPSGEEREGHEVQQVPKETVVVVDGEEEKEVPVIRPEPEPQAEMELDNSLPLCIGPGCSKQALPDSVYCGTDCILQHAAVTMKTLSVPKLPKSKGRAQRKAATARPTTKVQGSVRMSKRLSGKAEEEGEAEEVKDDDGVQKETASPLAYDPSLTEVQATSLPSSKFDTASKTDSNQVEADVEDVTPSKQSQEDTYTDAAPSSQAVTESATPHSHSQEKPKEPISIGVSKQLSAESNLCIIPEKSSQSPSIQLPSTSALRHHETGDLMVAKTTYVIPKKQSLPQPLSSHMSTPASCQKPSSAPTLLNETRNLPVPPAPSAPSSRPPQPNHQVRQSIQRSLTSILFKRVSDCEELEISESDVAKLVASIEMEMFDIFRNTDSKYMNKYRTIMFNLKDPRNKGLLYRVVRGEISPFRLVRMSQKDMQATKVSEPSAKETIEVKNTATKVTSLLQKPEAVKIDLPSLTPAKPERSTEHKKSLPAPAPAPKTRISQPSQSSALPDILTCMLKDTTSEHKTHLFDLKCKICTGQVLAGDEEEPSKKKPKVSETRDKYEPSWRKSAGDDSPLRAPPDSPDMDSPTSSKMDPSRLDSPVLTIVESPASPVMDSPASPTLESPASPVMDSPASPTPDTSKATTTKRAYTPVVIPAVSTVTITRRDPRTAASRSSALSDGVSGPDPRLYGTSSRTIISESPVVDETTEFLAKQDIVWKGFVSMLTVAKFVTKGYLVSGTAENLKADLPDTIQIGGRIMPETVWDYVAKLKTSVTKELCVIRFHPATEEEEVAYVSLFSYFSSRGRFGVVANSSRSIKDLYLVPLSAKEPVPSILLPLEGPGLEKKRPNLLLGLAIVQKVKRAGSFPQETEEKRPKVHMSKDPMWIPKPPVLYGSDKLEIFQPYDPESAASTTPPGSPSCPGSPSESSSSGSITIPSLLTSIRANTPVSTSATAATTQFSSNSSSDKNPSTESADKTPLHTILKSLFGNKETDSMVSSVGSSTTTSLSVQKLPVFSQGSGPMVDPIVQQYGQKCKVREIEDENDFDRPYDPEEEYDPAEGYRMVAPQSIEKKKADGPAESGFVDDDVAYDPEDETIFADIQSDSVAKHPLPTQMSDSPSCTVPVSTQAVMPAPISSTAQTSSPAGVTQNLPTGTVVVSAATLTEQQRMLEELNKQIEEQKRQLKEQEEALRQQREAVGMFMAHFSVSDSLMSPPTKSLPLSQLSSLQSGTMETESRPSESSNLSETVGSSNVDSKSGKLEDATTILNLNNNTNTVTEQDETQENVKESDKYSSAGEIEDSDVAYDPEDESLFDEIQEDVFQGGSMTTFDSSSRTGRSISHKDSTQNSYSRKRKLSPKRRSHRERDRQRSPSRKSQRRSPSHSQRRRERDRHRRGERDRSRRRTRDQSERQSRHRKEHSARRHSHGRRRSTSSSRRKDSVSLSPKLHRRPSPELLEKSSTLVTIKNDPDGHPIKCDLIESPDKESSHELHSVKLEISEPTASQELEKNSVCDHDDTARGSSTHVYTALQQETLLKNNIESTVPLREIDPPIRDSPQSPDPEPQFVKPSSTEKSGYVKTEKIADPETYTSVSMSMSVTTLHIGGQLAISNTLWPTDGSPMSNLRNLDLRTLDLQGPGVRNQGMTEADKQIEGGTPCLKHPQILGQQGGHSDLATGSDIRQGSGPEIDHLTKHPEPGMSDSGIKNLGSDVKELGQWRPQIYLRGTGIPGPDMRGPVMQSITPSILVPGQHIENLTTVGQDKYVRDPGTGMQGSETNHSTDKSGSGPVMRGSNMSSSNIPGLNPEVKGLGPDVRCSEPEIRGQMLAPAIINSHMAGLQNERRDQVMKHPFLDRPGLDRRASGSRESLLSMDHSSLDTRKPMVVDERRGQDVSCLQKGLLCLKTEEPRSQPENPIGRPRVMVIGRDQCFDGPQIEGRAPDIISRVKGQIDRTVKAHIGGSTSAMQGEGIRGPSPDIRGPGPWPDIRAEMGVHDPDMRESENMHELRRLDMTEVSYMGHCPGWDSMGEKGDRSDSHGRSSDREIGPNRRDADLQQRKVQGLRIERRNEQIAHEDRGPIPNSTNPDWRGTGPGLVGHDMRGQRSQNEGLGPCMSAPNWSGPGSDIGDDCSDSDRRRSCLVRGGPFIQDEWRNHQPDRKVPNMEDLRNDTRGPDIMAPVHGRRGPGGPDFNGPGPERGGSYMEFPMRDRRQPGGPDFRKPEAERRGTSNDNQRPEMRVPGHSNFVGLGLERRAPPIHGPWPSKRGPAGLDLSETLPERRGLPLEGSGPARRGPGGPDFRRPGPETRGLSMEHPGPDHRGYGGPDFRGTGPDRQGPAMGGPGPDRREHGGPDFRGPGPERRGPAIEAPHPDRRGPGCPDFSGPGADMRGPGIGGLGPDMRGPGGPDFRGPGPDGQGPTMSGPGPDRRGHGGPDFRGPGPERRCPAIEATQPDRRGPGGPDFSGPGIDRRELGVTDFSGPRHERRGHIMDSQESNRRGPGGPDFQGQGSVRGGLVMDEPGCNRRGPSVQGQGPDRRGPGDQNSGEMGPDKRGSFIRGPGSDFIGLESEQIGPGMEGPGPPTRGPGGSHFRGPESGHSNMEATGPDRRGPDIKGTRPERQDSGMEGPGPNRRGPGGPNMRRSGFQHSCPSMEGPVPDRRGPESLNYRGPGPEKHVPDMEVTGNSRSFPGGLQYRKALDRTVMENPGHHRKGPRGPDFRGPGCESRGPDIEGPGPDRQEPRGTSFREPGHERKGPDMQSPETDWIRWGGPGTGIRQKGPNTGGQRHRRDDWGGADFAGPLPIQECSDIDGPGPDRTGRNFRDSGLVRRNIRGPGPDMSSLNQGDRWKGPDFRGCPSDRRGTHREEQWSDGRGTNMGAIANEREGLGNDWKRLGNKGPEISEGPDEHVQKHIRQGSPMELRGHGSRGRKPGPLRGPGVDWSGSHCRDPGPCSDDPDMVCPAPYMEGSGNHLREPDRGGGGPNRCGPSQFLRGVRNSDNRDSVNDRRGPGTRGPGSDIRGGPHIGNDWSQPDFRGNMRGPNQEGPEAHREGPDLMNVCPNRREFEMEGLDRRGPRGPESRRPGPVNRNPQYEGPGTDERFSDCMGSDRQGVDMESPGTDRIEFDDLWRERRGPDIRRIGPVKTDIKGAGPENSDIKHWPGRWDTITEGPGLDSSGSLHFSSPHQVARFPGSNDPHSFPAEKSGGNSCRGYDNRQKQQAVKPQRHRGALLPTPTQGLIRFPNRMMNNPDFFGTKQKQIGHPIDKEWRRSRPVSRERGFIKGRRQEQEKSPAGKISTPGVAGTMVREKKKEEGNEPNKQGIHGACVETIINQSMDGNNSNVKPS
uniref:uncharacterized protein LOC124063618 isoform X2 n=1 Tax=Scatophagus argus TaxID=75038 RepID=UPI001ED7E036|nr:uncharacterized protein LOC124063618 isoform X2 [Scatophagus argus]